MEQRERQEERKEAKKMKSEVLKEVVEERGEERVFALGGGGQRPRVRALQISLQYHSEAGLWV